MELSELKSRRQKINDAADVTIHNAGIIEEESGRVAELAHNADRVLADLDSEFESVTRLNSTDVKFLMLATALQCTRIFLLNKITSIEKAGNKNKLENKLHEIQEDIFSMEIGGEKIFDANEDDQGKHYFAPLYQIVNGRSVPFDTQEYSKEYRPKSLSKKEKDALSLFKGDKNHRYATFGHDLVLGLIFGTGNILTNTISVRRTTLDLSNGTLKLPIIQTNHVEYLDGLRHPVISNTGSTTIMLVASASRLKNDKKSVIAATIKEVIHLGTDMFTPCGIYLPGMNLMMSKENIALFSKYISAGDVVKSGISGMLSELINTIISVVHMLTFDQHTADRATIETHSVKTRKIIDYANIIAMGSNVVKTALKLYSANVSKIGSEAIITGKGILDAADPSSLHEIDLGGIISLNKRLVEDEIFIREIKKEFVFNNFYKMIEGQGLDLRKPEL